MKLSTRSRYGTKMMLDLAQHCDEGPVSISDVAKRQGISVKYLEQLIIPLKKARFIKSVRGAKGGHLLAMPPEQISIGDLVRVLEGVTSLAGCIERPDDCERSEDCLTRGIWEDASKAMFDMLDGVTLSEAIKKEKKQHVATA